MSQNPPASLLRLREADVVRLCGLGAAARGLELVAQRAVRRGRRVGARLEAGVEDDGSVAVWWEQAAEQQPGPPRWGCERDAPDRDTPGDPISSPASPTPTLCCAHVAALLTAWIRSPADFPAPQTEEPESGDRVVVRQRHRLTQPMLVDSPSHRTVSPADPSLAAALARLSAADLAALARRVLGTEPDEP